MQQEKLGHVAEIQMNQLPSVDGKRKKKSIWAKVLQERNDQGTKEQTSACSIVKIKRLSQDRSHTFMEFHKIQMFRAHILDHPEHTKNILACT